VLRKVPFGRLCGDGKTAVPNFTSATGSSYKNNNGNPPYNTNPSSVVTATSNKLYELAGGSNTTDKVGLGITLRVMSGDTVSIYGKSYWHNTGSSPNNSYSIPVNDLLALLAGTSVVFSAGKGATSGALQGSSGIPTDLSHWIADSVPTVSGKPKAYYNWVLFDEQFRLVSSSSGFHSVGSTSDVIDSFGLAVNITRNGYLYVYCSNESNTPVFFDNFQVIHNHGPLLEENHYYPFGLTMAGISSKAAGKLVNREKFNGGNELQSGEFSDGSGLEMYDANFRMYDAQIGRFHQQDPLSDINEDQSLYSFANNNPVLLNDPLGLDAMTTEPAPLPEVVVTGVRPKPKPKPTPPSPPSVLPARTSPLPVAPSPPPSQTPVPAPAPSPTPEPTPLPPVEVIGTGALGAAGLTVLGVLLPLKAGADFPNGDETYYYKHPYERPSVLNPFVGHGNNKENSNPHIVYQFTFAPKDGGTPVLKYGISDELRNGTNRIQAQLAQLTALYGVTVKPKILQRTLNRQEAIEIERKLVSQHFDIWKRMPREQTRPTPF